MESGTKIKEDTYEGEAKRKNKKERNQVKNKERKKRKNKERRKKNKRKRGKRPKERERERWEEIKDFFEEEEGTRRITFSKWAKGERRDWERQVINV